MKFLRKKKNGNFFLKKPGEKSRAAKRQRPFSGSVETVKLFSFNAFCSSSINAELELAGV